LRPGDRAEITSVGRDPRAVVRASFKHSLYPPKAAFVFFDKRSEGEIAAMWGMGGDLLSDIGEPWLLTSPAVERVKVSFLRVVRTELAWMLARKRRLENHVAADYCRAIRLLEALGFTIEAPRPIGRHGALFRKFWIEA
jgi:hypothetical protein